jgi:hypothetical protein
VGVWTELPFDVELDGELPSPAAESLAHGDHHIIPPPPNASAANQAIARFRPPDGAACAPRDRDMTTSSIPADPEVGRRVAREQ